MAPKARRKLLHNWQFWAREDQYWTPGDEKFTLFMAGRGWGKTRVGAGAINESAEYRAEQFGGEFALIGKTPKAVRADMIEGPAGIMRHAKPWFKPKYYSTQKRLVYPNGVVCHVYSAHNPSEMRGPQVGLLWCDELCHWKYPDVSWEEGVECFLRHGNEPKCIITTTPLPMPLLEGLVADPQVRVVHGSSADNLGNVAPDFIERIYRRFHGTDLAEQELHGRILAENKRSLWKHRNIIRITPEECPGLFRIVVAVDPAGGSDEDTNDETGIVVAGIDKYDNFYVLEDASGHYEPHEWAETAISQAETWGADAIVGEKNYGGALVRSNIAQHPNYSSQFPIEIVTATRSKGYRSAPVATMYAKKRGYHVSGDQSRLAELERQMVQFDPTKPRNRKQLDKHGKGGSPDRMDAMVWAAIALLGEGDDTAMLREGSAEAMSQVFEDLEDDDGDHEIDDMFDDL